MIIVGILIDMTPDSKTTTHGVSGHRYDPKVVMVKFLHTADWQLGKAPFFLSEDARPRFRGARLDVIDAIGRLARDQGCRFVVVSGDVFDSNLVERQVLVRALDKMGANPQVHFYLLPGNHDPLDASSIFRCRTFTDLRPDNVTVLDEAGPVEAAPGVELVAAPWPTKRPLSDLVDDACERLEASDAVRIVVGHGAVDELSPSTSNPALISLERIEERIGSALIQYVALGDRHSTTELGSTGRVWYSGAPEPTDDDEDDPGNVLLVSLDREDVQVEARQVGTWRFERTDWELGTDADIEALGDWLASLGAKDRTIIRVDLRGQVSVAQKAHLDDMIAHHSELLACLREDNSDLAVIPDNTDLDDFELSGYALEALRDLFQMAATGDQASEAQGALSLLYRLAGAGR